MEILCCPVVQLHSADRVLNGMAALFLNFASMFSMAAMHDMGPAAPAHHGAKEEPDK
ncbi:MAG TPA: hypothetical protein VIU33_05615 [Nitrospiria bacterium]